jgi:hypothetical protein
VVQNGFCIWPNFRLAKKWLHILRDESVKEESSSSVLQTEFSAAIVVEVVVDALQV